MPTINEQVAEKLKGISPVVEGMVIDVLVSKELNRRVELITQGLTRLEEMVKEGYKLNKPDTETYDGEGNLSSATFTKERTEARKKLGEKHDKLQKALEKALTGDTGDLANLVNQKPGQ